MTTDQPRFRGEYLLRRARHLGARVGAAEGPGLSYDACEYAELCYAFKALGIDFDKPAPGPRFRGEYLMRRARHLESMLAARPKTRTGLSYDACEYAELLCVFTLLHLDYAPMVATVRERADTDETYVPSEPRRSQYLPGV